jgi:PAS domain-containing protein
MSEPIRLLCLSSDAALVARWIAALRAEGLQPTVRHAHALAEWRVALATPAGGPFDLALAEADAPASPAPAILRALAEVRNAPPLILLGRRPGPLRAARALRHGARDWLAPEDLPRLGAVARRELATGRRYQALLDAEDWMVSLDTSYRALLDQLSEAVMLTAADGLLLAANAAACDLLGLSRDMLGLMSLPELLDDPSGWLALCRQVNETGAPATSTVRLVGEALSAPMRLTLCSRPGGAGAGYGATLRALAGSGEIAAAAPPHLARRVRDLAHDINNHLMSLSLSVGMVQEHPALPGALEPDVSLMVRASASAGALTHQLLRLAREADRTEREHA